MFALIPAAAMALTLAQLTTPTAKALGRGEAETQSSSFLCSDKTEETNFAPLLPCASAVGFDERSSPRTAPPDQTPRSVSLTAMYVAFAGLQAADAHSTLSAISGGATEANPAMRGVAGHPGSLIAVKAAASVATIWVSEKMRKKHPKGALVMMVALNSALATVVAHNYRVR